MRARTLLFLVTLVASPGLYAAACCTSATAFGTGRLLLWEKWAFGVKSQANHELGFYDDTGRFEAADPDSIDQQLRLDAYALYPTSEYGSVFVVLPWVFPRIGTQDSVQTGANISDVQIGYRHQLIAIGEYEELPGIAVTGSVLFPTGNPRNRDVDAHDVTGRDALILMAGTSLEKTWMPFFAQINLGASILFNQFRTQNRSSDPITSSFQVVIASGMEITTDWVMSLVGSWTYEVPEKWKTNAGFATSFRINPHFTVQANVTTDLFINGSGSNWPGNFGYGFGVRYGYF